MTKQNPSIFFTNSFLKNYFFVLILMSAMMWIIPLFFYAEGMNLYQCTSSSLVQWAQFLFINYLVWVIVSCYLHVKNNNKKIMRHVGNIVLGLALSIFNLYCAETFVYSLHECVINPANNSDVDVLSNNNSN